MGHITTVANHKGGVGKTNEVELLAAELAIRGFRVLVVDGDPQGNLSRRLGYQEHELAERPTIAEAIREADPRILKASILPCQWAPDWAERISLVPSRIELEERVSEAGVPHSWRRLKKALGPVAAEYDHVLIDTPPSIGHLLHLALVASDHVIAAASPTYDAVRGVRRLNSYIEDEENRTGLGMTCRLIGVVINLKRSGVVNHDARAAELLASFGDRVWQPALPLRASVEDASERAEPPQNAGTEVKFISEQRCDAYLKAVAA